MSMLLELLQHFFPAAFACSELWRYMGEAFLAGLVFGWLTGGFAMHRWVDR